MSLHTRSSSDTFFSGEYIFLMFRNFCRIFSIATASGGTAPSTPSSWGFLVLASAKFSLSCCKAPLLTCSKQTMHHWYQGFIFSIAYLLIYEDTFLRSSPGSHAKPSRWRCSEVLRHICAWPSPAPGLWKRTHPHTDNRLSTRRNVMIISLSNQIIKCVTVCCAMTS